MSKPPAPKYLISGVDTMRAELGVTPNRLAGAAGCSLSTTQAVLREEPRSKGVCERIVKGLKTLGHGTVSIGDIVAAN